MGEMADEHRDNMWCDEVKPDFNKCVYFAHPQSLYNKPAEWRCERDIKRVFDMCIVNPRFMWDNYDAAIENSNVVVFMSDDGILGKGTVANVSLARTLSIPVYYYEDKVFYQDGTIRLMNGGRNWAKYATIVTKGKVYKSLKPRLTWFDRLNAKLLQWREQLERRVNHDLRSKRHSKRQSDERCSDR